MLAEKARPIRAGPDGFVAPPLPPIAGRGGGDGHDEPPISETMSKATPSGLDGLPLGSLRRAWRMVSRGTPCWRARLATTAESFAAESEWLPALELLMKISARSPFGKREKVAQ